ncbi:MAG: DUF6452 family protein [Bacteroidales bacterium]|jgi:hypothetical protein|nr:DUF6452 family protein [Bacteroidales bacterium]MCU0408831.1 DUF6452 family protein [Bacteroidales bacterium]
MINPVLRNFLLSIAGVVLSLSSCTQEACNEETIPLVVATFYRTGSDSIRTADSVTVYGIGMEDSKLYDNAKKVQYLELPLDMDAASSGFVLKINAVTDTLRLNYSNYPHLVSEECGVTFFHSLESYSVSGSRVDTVIFRVRNVTTTYEENIRIFF